MIDEMVLDDRQAKDSICLVRQAASPRDYLSFQSRMMEDYCERVGGKHKIIVIRKPPFQFVEDDLVHVLNALHEKSVGRLVVAHSATLPGAALPFVMEVCERLGIEVVFLNDPSVPPVHSAIDMVRSWGRVLPTMEDIMEALEGSDALSGLARETVEGIFNGVKGQ